MSEEQLHQIRVNAALYRIEAGMTLVGDDAEILATAYRLLEAELEAFCAWKRSLDEALNSGDGAYRP